MEFATTARLLGSTRDDNSYQLTKSVRKPVTAAAVNRRWIAFS
jgi:hypothetical protein